jgi:hypothetical protein
VNRLHLSNLQLPCLMRGWVVCMIVGRSGCWVGQHGPVVNCLYQVIQQLPCLCLIDVCVILWHEKKLALDSMQVRHYWAVGLQQHASA